MQDPSYQQGQPSVAAQGVYVGGTYPATLTRDPVMGDNRAKQ
jgi:hypothetical protein